jgi:U3 small nucleolar RNA-associated protein 18
LRVTEAEDLVNGREYIRRLRRQYQLLHPTPGWASTASNAKRRKKVRGIGGRESDESSSGDEMDTGDETEMSTQPLTKLLQGASELLRRDDSGQKGAKRKLRQGALDIQRLKDVGGNQPVSL